MVDIVRNVSQNIFIPFTVGGGIRRVEDFFEMLSAGADKVSVNSAAVKSPDIINEASYKFGSQCVVIAIDSKKSKQGKYEVYINGGRDNTGIDAVEWAMEAQSRGAGEILLTSMDCDGIKNGYNLGLTKAISESVSITVIASGGAGKMKDFYDVFTNANADAALSVSLFHFEEIRIPDLKRYLADALISVRI